MTMTKGHHILRQK